MTSCSSLQKSHQSDHEAQTHCGRILPTISGEQLGGQHMSGALHLVEDRASPFFQENLTAYPPFPPQRLPACWQRPARAALHAPRLHLLLARPAPEGGEWCNALLIGTLYCCPAGGQAGASPTAASAPISRCRRPLAEVDGGDPALPHPRLLAQLQAMELPRHCRGGGVEALGNHQRRNLHHNSRRPLLQQLPADRCGGGGPPPALHHGPLEPCEQRLQARGEQQTLHCRHPAHIPCGGRAAGQQHALRGLAKGRGLWHWPPLTARHTTCMDGLEPEAWLLAAAPPSYLHLWPAALGCPRHRPPAPAPTPQPQPPARKRRSLQPQPAARHPGRSGELRAGDKTAAAPWRPSPAQRRLCTGDLHKGAHAGSTPNTESVTTVYTCWLAW